MAPVLRLITKWPFSTWWISGLLTAAILYLAEAYLGTSYDDGGIGTALFVLSLFTAVPIESAKKIVLAYRETAVVTTGDWWLAIAISGALCLALDRVLQLVIYHRRRS